MAHKASYANMALIINHLSNTSRYSTAFGYNPAVLNGNTEKKANASGNKKKKNYFVFLWRH